MFFYISDSGESLIFALVIPATARAQLSCADKAARWQLALRLLAEMQATPERRRDALAAAPVFRFARPLL